MKRQRQGGFTLIEVLVVLLLMVIIMAMGVTVMPGVLKSSQLSTGGRQVYATLNLARQMAIAQRTQVQVACTNFNSSSGGVIVTNAAYGLMTNALSSWVIVERWEYLPQGVVFNNSPGDYVRFDQTGAATVKNNVANWGLLIVDGSSTNRNNWMRIDVDQLLGRITTVRP